MLPRMRGAHMRRKIRDDVSEMLSRLFYSLPLDAAPAARRSARYLSSAAAHATPCRYALCRLIDVVAMMRRYHARCPRCAAGVRARR